MPRIDANDISICLWHSDLLTSKTNNYFLGLIDDIVTCLCSMLPYIPFC